MKKGYSLIFLLALTLLSHSVNAQLACALDPGWDTDGKLVADGSRLGENIIVQPDGKVLVSCNPFGDSYAYIKRYNPDGSLDASYGTAGQFTVQVAERRTDIDGMVLHNGTLYICGSTTTDIGGTNTYVYAAAIQANGGWENGFGTGGVKKFNSGITDFYIAGDIGVDGNGKIYMAGLEWLDNAFVVRMNTSGVLDASWDGDGVAFFATNNTDHWFEVIDLDFDKAGKVLIAGKKYKANNGSSIPVFWNVMIARFNSNGSLDGGFATGGVGLYSSGATNLDEGRRIQVTAQNDYVVIGNTYDGVDYDYSIVKVLNTGMVDPAFGNAGWSINDLELNNEMEYCLTGALLPDGRILATGNQGSGDTVHFALLALTPSGVRDNAFAPNGLFMNIFNQNNNSSSSGLALTSDGKIYLGGYTRTCANGVCGPLYMALSRYVGGTPSVSMSDPNALQFKIYPNPAHSGQQVQLQTVDADALVAVSLIDMSGREFAINPAGASFVLPDLCKGLYICRLQTDAGVVMSRLLVE